MLKNKAKPTFLSNLCDFFFNKKSSSWEVFSHLFFFFLPIWFSCRKKKICEAYAKAMGMEEALNVRNESCFHLCCTVMLLLCSGGWSQNSWYLKSCAVQSVLPRRGERHLVQEEKSCQSHSLQEKRRWCMVLFVLSFPHGRLLLL